MTRKSAIILLAGGQARRMGGGDKNLIELAGKPVLRHVLDRVDFANRPIMLNANGDPARYADLACRFVLMLLTVMQGRWRAF